MSSEKIYQKTCYLIINQQKILLLRRQEKITVNSLLKYKTFKQEILTTLFSGSEKTCPQLNVSRTNFENATAFY